jgi:hypothetical protein
VRALVLLAIAWLLLVGAPSASAHKPSDSYLALRVQGSELRGDWELGLRDLDYALDIDGDGDGRITWGELRARRETVAAYALAHLRIEAPGGACPLRAGDLQVNRRSDGTYAVLRVSAGCAREPARIAIDYGLFFELDPQHRGLVRIEHPDGAATAILDPESRRQWIELARAQPWTTLLVYAREGVWHILGGTDHVLFLLTLLLPSVLRRERGRWLPKGKLGAALREVVQVVTAFTVAHSLTLGAAVLGLVSVPSRLIESAIAASVVLVALHNLRPVLGGGRWGVAFGFGLLHGFGFAGALAELGLPSRALAEALLGFNAGVEAGQLAIVASFLPVAFATRRSVLYPRLALGFGSGVIALVGGVWFLERSLDLGPLLGLPMG